MLTDLSEREEQVLKLLSEGLPYKNVAATLAISPNTLREYIRRLYRKLGVHTRHEAVAHYRSRQQPADGNPFRAV